jgi:hypothetical protein
MTSIGSKRLRAKEKILDGALNPIREYVTNELVLESCRGAQHSWNACVWSPVLTLLACVWKQLQATASARQVEDWIASLDVAEFSGNNDGADFCAARLSAAPSVFRDVMRKIGATDSAQAGQFFKALPEVQERPPEPRAIVQRPGTFLS